VSQGFFAASSVRVMLWNQFDRALLRSLPARQQGPCQIFSSAIALESIRFLPFEGKSNFVRATDCGHME